MLLAIGSPALAGYSLAVTRLNSRWLSHQFIYLNFPTKGDIPFAVSALQHIPFKIDASGSLLSSLIVLHQNDQYWDLLGKAAKDTRQLSIPVAMNIVWALVAFLLTIVDSFVDFDHFITVPGDAGYSIAIVWSYLLPLVIGWLHVGCQPYANYLSCALRNTHKTAYVATTEPVLATQVAGRSTHAIDLSTSHDYVNADEKKTVPIFNYSRVFIWSQNAEHILKLYKNAAFKYDWMIPVRTGEKWMNNDNDRTGNEAEVMQYCMVPFDPNLVYGSSQMPTPLTPYPAFPLSPETSAETSLIARTNDNPYAFADKRLPSAPSTYDEEATPTEAPEEPVCNSSQIPTHLTPYPAFPLSPEPSAETSLIARTNENPAFAHKRFPSAPSKYDEEAMSTEVPEEPVFATGVFLRVVSATILALGLQWGTTGASILIHLNTQPKGLGCRALTFVLYGAAATVAFLLLLFSSIISHLVRPQSAGQKRSGLNTLIGCIAAGTRWLGKLIAIMNGFGILLSCTMQFAGVYDNCFCSSMVYRGHSNGFISFIEEDVKKSEVFSYWIGGIVMGFGISGLYTFAIYVTTPM